MPALPPPPPPPSSSQPTNFKRFKAFLVGSCIFVLVGGLGLLVLLASGIKQGFHTVSGSNQSTVQETVLSGDGTAKIAVINLHGSIVTDGSSTQGTTSALDVKRMLKQAKDDETVKAVILDIDSPGGGVVASSQIYTKIKEVTAAGKPVVAVYSGDVAASGALYASMAATTILSDPETLTGSIGVIASFYDISELMSKYGVRENVIKSGTYKDIGSSTREMTTAERQILQNLIDDSFNRFVGVVAENRHLSIDQVKQFATGEVFSATRAKNFGLIDDLGSREDAEQKAKELAHLQKATLVEYQPSFSFGSIFDLFSSKLINLSPLSLIDTPHRSSSFGLYYLLN